LQVFGGYGYVAEFAIEQTLRDSRIAMIYEGSNEIQANDLLLRKVLGDGGQGFALLLEQLRDEAEHGAQVPECAGFARPLADLTEALQALVAEVQQWALEDAEYPYRAAGDFLALCGLSLLALAWARAARVSRKLPEGDPLRGAKLETAGFFFSYLLPQVEQRMTAVRNARAALAFV